MCLDSKSISGLFVLIAIFLLSSTVSAGLVKRSSRMVREVYPPEIEPENEGNQAQVCIVGDVVYGADETVPAEQPCLKCRCQPPGVQCETVQCAKKPGCKAIHRPNKCCPDYQCECEHEGKIYANGERLEANPGGECKVCYCRGGEIQCAEVSCYIRKDCEGKRVPGKCCPKYDHCPPIDSLPERLGLTTEAPKSTVELWQNSPINNSTPSLPTPAPNIPQDENKVPDTSDPILAPPPSLEIVPKEDGMLPRITIQEIIPETKEIPITAPPKVSPEPQGTLLIEEAVVTRNDLNLNDSYPESSEVAETFHRPPPVLRIGDTLVDLKGKLVPEHDTDSVITVIGAEGLQRGFEESGEVHEVRLGEIETPDTNDLELKTAESTHVLSLLPKQIATTTEETLLTTQTSSIEVPAVEVEANLTTEAIASSEKPLNISKAVVSTEFPIRHTDPILEQNPAYPPIPDIMPAVGDVSQKFEVEIENDNSTMQVKILPDILDIVSNSSRPSNVSNADWLKNGSLADFQGSLPDELLNEKSPIDVDEDSTTEEVTTATYEETTTEEPLQKSVESFEQEDSGEEFAPETNHSAIVSTENASIEKSDKEISEANDMAKELMGSSSEGTTSMHSDVELLVPVTPVSETNKNNTLKRDVEVININSLVSPTKINKIETSTYELLPTPEETSSRVIKKRR